MAFTWKEHKDIWKGEGIYFLTFVVTGRAKLLGKLVSIEESCFYPRNVQRSENKDGIKKPTEDSNEGKHDKDNDTGNHYNHIGKYTCKEATVDLSTLGLAVSWALLDLKDIVPEVKVCAKQIMPDHIHAVIWVQEGCCRSIRQIGNGFRIGIKRKAVELGAWSVEDGHILEVPFIRTLVHKGQLSSMIDYVHANPDNAWARHLNPTLYTIRRNLNYADLHFDGMGKERLLDYPDRQVIALSRSLTQEQIESEVAKALYNAEKGTVTYTAAINEGEKAVSKAIRENGYPLVVMMLDGFPPEGSEAARYFHPNGVYHKVCGEGRLMLLTPKLENYDDPRLIELTEAELTRKAAEKGLYYTGIPHDSKRWRMIAGNVMLKMIAEEI